MKNVYNNKMTIFLLLLAFFKPICLQYYRNLQLIDSLYDVYKILAAVIILSLGFFRNGLHIKIYKQYCTIFLLGIWSVIVTVACKGYVFRAIIDFVTIYVIYIFVANGIKYNAVNVINQAWNVIFMLVILQLVSELVYPNGMPADLYSNNASNPLFFMTLDNGTASLTILGVTLLYIRKELNVKTKKPIYLVGTILCLITALLSGSTTALICTLMMVCVPLLVRFFNKHSAFDRPMIWIAIYLILFALVVLGGSNSIVAIIMSTVTGKVGFTGRTFLWEKAIEMIKKAPIIGYGRQTQKYISAWGGYFSSHNVLLEAMLQGGIVEVILWICCIYNSAISVKKCSNRYLAKIMLSSLFIVLISMMMEVSVFSNTLFLLLAIIGGSRYLNCGKMVNKNGKVS